MAGVGQLGHKNWTDSSDYDAPDSKKEPTGDEHASYRVSVSSRLNVSKDIPFIAPVTRAVPTIQIRDPRNIAVRLPHPSENPVMKKTPRMLPIQYDALRIPKRLPLG